MASKKSNLKSSIKSRQSKQSQRVASDGEPTSFQSNPPQLVKALIQSKLNENQMREQFLKQVEGEVENRKMIE